jgi:hypothetical protein
MEVSFMSWLLYPNERALGYLLGPRASLDAVEKRDILFSY